MPVVDNLELRLQSEASSAIRSLDQLISRLDTLSGALVNVNSGGLNRLSLSVRNLSSALRVMSGVKAADYTRIAGGLGKLSSVDNASISKAAANINTLASSINKLEFSDGKFERFKLLTDGVSTFGRANVTKAITNLPLLGTALQDFFTKVAASPNVENNLIGMTNALSSLMSRTGAYASTINRLSTTSKALTRDTNNQTNAQNRLNRSFLNGSSFGTGFAVTIAKITGAFFTVRRLITGLMKSIKSSMDFTETVNLFETAFRKIGLDSGEAFEMAFLDRAYDFNKKFTSLLTLDPNEIMNYQARFGAMSNSMGVVGETAFNISSAFTALGADIASLFNIDIPVAMQKLQSGLAGQIRPLRDIGVDISKTSIAQTAMNYGITESIEKMSAATKVQLRFLTTIRQMRIAMGDMARTINSPANQLRILQEQWRLMARAFGNIFLPVVARVLPYLNAVLIAITRIMNRIASVFGFKLPSFKETPIYMGDIPDPMEGLEDDPFDPISSGAGNATDKVKELKKALAGFDELNVLNLSDTPSDSGGGGGGGSGGYGMGTGSGYGILDEAIADEWFNYQEAIGAAFDEMANKASGIADTLYEKFMKFAPFFEGVWEGLKDVWEAVKMVYNAAVKPLIEWMDNWIADNPEFIEGLGKIQGWVWGMIGLSAAFKLAWGGVNFLATITGLSTISKLLFGGKVAGTATTMTKGAGILGGLTTLAGMTAGSLPLLPILAAAAATVFVVEVISIKTEEWNESGVGSYVQQQGQTGVSQRLPNLGKPTTEDKVELLNTEQLKTYETLLRYNVPGALQYLEAMTKGSLTKVEQRTAAHQYQQVSDFRKIEKGIVTAGNAHLTLPDKVKTAMGGASSTIMGTNTSNWAKHLTEWTGGVQTKTKSAMDNVATSVGTGTSKALDEFGRLKNQSLVLTDAMANPLHVSATRAGSSVSSGIKSGTDQATKNTDAWAKVMPSLMGTLGSTLLSTVTASGRNIPKGLAVGQNTAGSNMTTWTGGLLTQFSLLGGGLDRIMVGSSKAWSGAFVNNLSVLYDNLRAFARMIGVTLPYYWSPTYSGANVSYTPTTSSGITDNRLNISAWASGGQPPIGQLFYAREAGAELVGNVGGRTTVMNNDQIVESVATGVANAVASVLGGGTNQPIIVQVGSDTLVDTVINGLNRRSRAMGSPVALGV